jgi:hypothetical protein
MPAAALNLNPAPVYVKQRRQSPEAGGAGAMARLGLREIV